MPKYKQTLQARLVGKKIQKMEQLSDKQDRVRTAISGC